VVHDPYADVQFEYKTDKDDLWLDANALTLNNDRGGPGSILNIPITGPYDGALTTPDWSLAFNPNFPYSGGAVPGSVVGQIGTNNPAIANIRDFAQAIPTDINVRGAYTVLLHETHHMNGVDLKYVGGYSQYRYNLFTSDFETDNSPITQYQVPLDPTGPCATGALGPCGPLTVFPQARFQYETETKWFSHELTLSSTNNSPLQWITGVYYYNETDNNVDTWYNPQQPQIASPNQVLPLFGAVPDPFVPALPNPSHDYLFLDYQDSINSVAGYGQVDWKVTPTIKLTGGLRYTYDYKSAIEEARYILFSSGILSPYEFGSAMPALDITPLEASTAAAKGVTCPTTYPTTGPWAGDAVRCLGDHSAALTGTAGIEWTPDEDTLAYARYNRGYKAFGFNAGLIAPNPEAKPETVDDFEIGFKKNFGHTLVIDIDAFYYNYLNDQVPLGVSVADTILTEFVNIPKAVSDGVELQATWTPIDHLSLTLVYGFDHTANLSTCTSVGGVPTGACYEDANDPLAQEAGARPVGNTVGGVYLQAINGDELPQAPENKVAFNATYTIPFGVNNLILSGSFIWKDKSYAAIFERYDYLGPAWDQVDLRATWSGDHDRYEVVLYVKNLFNSLGYDAADGGYQVANPVGGGPAPTWVAAYDLTPPRLYGVELHFKF
jgi:iron complex outermembrane receptor protein